MARVVSLLLVRHAETAWNAAGRIQGQTDVPLSPAGRSALAARSIPARFGDFRWVASPLRRAMETALLLGGRDVLPEPRLMEMDWAAWEGRSRKELRRARGRELAAHEARGLDFRPPGGESPRLLQERLRCWLAEVGASGQSLVAVTHKGVVRALLSLATGWDMTGKSPVRLDWSRAHLFRLEARTTVRLVQPNIPLE